MLTHSARPAQTFLLYAGESAIFPLLVPPLDPLGRADPVHEAARLLALIAVRAGLLRAHNPPVCFGHTQKYFTAQKS